MVAVGRVRMVRVVAVRRVRMVRVMAVGRVRMVRVVAVRRVRMVRVVAVAQRHRKGSRASAKLAARIRRRLTQQEHPSTIHRRSLFVCSIEVPCNTCSVRVFFFKSPATMETGVPGKTAHRARGVVRRMRMMGVVAVGPVGVMGVVVVRGVRMVRVVAVRRVRMMRVVRVVRVVAMRVVSVRVVVMRVVAVWAVPVWVVAVPLQLAPPGQHQANAALLATCVTRLRT